jgi:Ca-activated chloride channel homolog
VSLRNPAALLLLVLPVALLAAYVVVQRRRRRYAVRFTSVDLLASVAPRRPGWPRHIPAGLLAAALALLAVAVARPEASHRVARNRATIVLVLDTSASMAAEDVAPSRLVAAQQQASSFVKGLPEGLQIGLLSFDRSARVLVSPTTDRQTVLAAIATLQIGPGTATADALELALDAVQAAPKAADGTTAPALVILMSDGSPTIGTDDLTPAQAVTEAAKAAQAAGVPVNTIAFGTPDGTVTVQGRTVDVPADVETMDRIAAETGGRSFNAESATELKSVYEQLGEAVGYDTRTEEVGVWFTVVGLVLAALAAVAALLFTERLL